MRSEGWAPHGHETVGVVAVVPKAIKFRVTVTAEMANPASDGKSSGNDMAWCPV